MNKTVTSRRDPHVGLHCAWMAPYGRAGKISEASLRALIRLAPAPGETGGRRYGDAKGEPPPSEYDQIERWSE